MLIFTVKKNFKQVLRWCDSGSRGEINFNINVLYVWLFIILNLILILHKIIEIELAGESSFSFPRLKIEEVIRWFKHDTKCLKNRLGLMCKMMCE